MPQPTSPTKQEQYRRRRADALALQLNRADDVLLAYVVGELVELTHGSTGVVRYYEGLEADYGIR